MKAAIFHGPSDLRMETVGIPELQPGEVLIEVGAAVTCATDFKAFRQGHPVLLNNRLPSPFGHEVAGTVVELGTGVKNVSVGERVVAANSAPCDRCYFCEQGTPNLCDNLELLNGAYAEYIVIPAQIAKHNLCKIPDGIAFETAALTEPVACVARAIDHLELKKAEHLAILGSGLMGRIFIQFAKQKGAQVTAIGRSHDKLEQAKGAGADHVFSTLQDKDVVVAARKMTPQERGFDAVVEAVGKPEAWEQAVGLARKGGRVCLYGGCAKGSTFNLDTHRVHYQELKIFGVFHHSPKHVRQALAALCDGTIDAADLLNGEIKLSDVARHFSENSTTAFAKVVVRP